MLNQSDGYWTDANIDDELFTIQYDHSRMDNYAGEWKSYAELRQVFNERGDPVNIMTDHEFYRKCELAANDSLKDYLSDYYYEEDGE